MPFISVFLHTKSFSNIISAWRSSADSILTTTVLALSASIISTAIAMPIAHHLAHSRRHFTGFLDILCWIPIAIPGTIIGLGFIKLSNSLPAFGLKDSYGIVLLLAYIGMFSAFAIRILEASYRRSDPNIDEAAALDCSKWFQRLIHIELPIHFPAIIV